MEEMIKISHGCVKAGKTVILRDVDLTVPRQSICGIVGRNGSGKTVLFKTICGFYTLTSGELYINGTQIKSDGKVPGIIGSMIEAPGFLSGYSGFRNLKFLADINGKIGKKEIRQVIDTVGLTFAGRKKVGKYSMGMKQRLGIAQAIMEGQELLILDEPMNGLDEQGVEDVRKLLLDLREQGRTILIASHNREDIDILCDEVYRMVDGVLRKEDTR